MLDWTLSKLLHGAVNTALQQHEIGSVAGARVVWKEREVHLYLNLEGEISTVELKACQVEFIEEGQSVFVSVGEVKCSRKWVENAVKNLQPNIRAKLPDKVATALKMARVVKPQP